MNTYFKIYGALKLDDFLCENNNNALKDFTLYIKY